MEWADGASQLITAVTGLLVVIGGAVGWWIGRRDARAKTKQTEQAAIKTVESLESTTLHKNDQIHQLQADFDRAHAIIASLDERMERKDQRIAHLETLLDKRGAAQ